MTNRSTVLVMLAAVLVVVVVVVETRPPRIKREQLFCSSREIRQMLVYVCNIARRSVHSQGPPETSTSLAPEWLSEERYNRPNFHKLPLQTEAAEVSHRVRTSETPSRARRNGGSYAFGNVQTNLIERRSGGQSNVVNEIPARNNVDKRDGDSGEAQTIGDLRAKCCVEECTAQDFLGACS
ncbi:uncharacterized protein [Panulirus ornatus]|uniref:uncharacterized protein n=1 Tax=Panulirus ornatus TaxID=150431 RepID=UPI003A85336D